MPLNTLQELLDRQIRSLYRAQSDLTCALPELIRSTQRQSLKRLLECQLHDSRHQSERLLRAAAAISINPEGGVCPAMTALLDECLAVPDQPGHARVLDAAIVAALLRMAHLQIGAYTITIAIANDVGSEEVASILGPSLREEQTAADLLVRGRDDLLYAHVPHAHDCRREQMYA